MKVLVTGLNGQLGYDVVRMGQLQGIDVIGVNRQDLDITVEDEVNRTVERIQPDAIIHCAAYTAVDKAEDEQEICRSVNVEGTLYLARAAQAINAKFMYISTDYVFDGEGLASYTEEDLPNPVGYYGLTKLQGEQVVQTTLKNWFIIRISWVFGVNGSNFVKTMLRLAESHSEVGVVCDQFGSPTYTWDLARLLLDMIQSDKYGIYHASNEGICSWADFAEEIFKLAGKDTSVKRISTEEYPTRAIRPRNSRLSKQKLANNGFGALPHWQDALERYLKEISNKGGIS